MTFEEFLVAFEAKRKAEGARFLVVTGGCLRKFHEVAPNRYSGVCPLQFLSGLTHGSLLELAPALKMKPDEMSRVWTAADNVTSLMRKEDRTRLLAAAGVEQ